MSLHFVALCILSLYSLNYRSGKQALYFGENSWKVYRQGCRYYGNGASAGTELTFVGTRLTFVGTGEKVLAFPLLFLND